MEKEPLRIAHANLKHALAELSDLRVKAGNIESSAENRLMQSIVNVSYAAGILVTYIQLSEDEVAAALEELTS
jgi:hypothetical protein